jgi:hypothetical protein
MVAADKRRTTGPLRDKLLGILLTPAEWAEVDDYCAAQGLTASSGGREILLSHIRRSRLATAGAPASKGES